MAFSEVLTPAIVETSACAGGEITVPLSLKMAEGLAGLILCWVEVQFFQHVRGKSMDLQHKNKNLHS